MAITAEDVLTIISEEVPIDRARLDPAATLESLDIASLDMISVMFALEDKFGLVIEQETPRRCRISSPSLWQNPAAQTDARCPIVSPSLAWAPFRALARAWSRRGPP
jgi:acyl carrier protein